MNKKNHDESKNTPSLDETKRNKKPILINQDDKKLIKENHNKKERKVKEEENSIFEIMKDESINILLKEAQDLGIDSEDETDTISNLTFTINEEIAEGEKRLNLLTEKIRQKNLLLKKEAKKIAIAHTLFHIKEKEIKDSKDKLSHHEEVEFKQKLLLANYDLVKSHIIDRKNNTEKNISNIINEMHLSLLEKQKERFDLALESYISYYKKNKKQSLNSKVNLTLEEKVELFYSNYFTDVLKSEEIEIKYSLIEIMLKNYDKTIFFDTMSKYEIPSNIPIKESINSNHNYYPVWHIAIMFNKFEFIEDSMNNAHLMEEFQEPFYSKIIEQENIIEYEYRPFSSLAKLNQNQVMYLINKSFINKDTEVYTSFDKKKSLFLALMEQSYLEAFKLLYYKELEQVKTKNPEINKLNLKKIVTEKKRNNLLHHYIYALNEGDIKEVDKDIIEIFIREQFDLDYLNSDDLSAFDYCESISDKNLYHLCEYLYPIIPAHYKNMPEIENFIEEPKEVPIQEVKEQEYMWYNRDKLIVHEKEIAKLKEASNHEFIKAMLNPTNYLKKNLLVEDEALFDKLEVEFPNFKEVIKFYKGQFRVKKMSGKVRISPILLLGDPGIGKSYFAKKLSQYLKTGYTFLDMGSLSAGWVLTGNNGTWKDAKQGKILEAVMSSKTINPIVVMDELDKTNRSNYDPVSVLYQLLEEINAREFTDEFIDFPIDASGVVYIACANSIQNIPEPLLSRFKIFEISNPDEKQISHIIHNIYQENVKDLPVFERDITEPIIYKLKKFSLRAIKVMIEDAVSTALLELSQQECEEQNKHIILNEKHFVEPKKKTVIGF